MYQERAQLLSKAPARGIKMFLDYVNENVCWVNKDLIHLFQKLQFHLQSDHSPDMYIAKRS